ncbi:osmotically inducible protein OsmC [Lactobacillus sp. PFC-70]|nr:osmotically inducible protein OsmC [Lactobacillus sp. PFC-70]
MSIDTYKVKITGSATSDRYQASVRDFSLELAPNSTQAANAYEAILEALGGCESIVMGSFYRKQKFTYRSFYLTLEGLQEAPTQGLSEIKVGVHFDTPENKKACTDFVEFAEATCPVMDNLTNTVPIKRTAVTIKH